MHGANIKIVDTKQAKAYYTYKNIRLKLGALLNNLKF
jgi:hypothetical protein